MNKEALKNEIRETIVRNHHELFSEYDGGKDTIRDLSPDSISVDFESEENAITICIATEDLNDRAYSILFAAIKKTANQLFGQYISPNPDLIGYSAPSLSNSSHWLSTPGALRWRHSFDSIHQKEPKK